MSDSLTAHDTAEPRPAWRRRLAKAARFVAIVWGLAVALLGLQYLESLLLGTAIEKGALDPELVTLEVPENPACGHRVAALEPAELDEAGRARSRRQAFELGLDLGFEAGALHARLAGGEAVPEPPRGRAALAAELGVPAPGLPEVERRANMFQEYTVYLAADPQCVAASLAKVYSPGHAALYRLGAVAATSVTYRRLGLVEASYRADLRRYGEAAGAPKDLLAPLTREGDPDTVRQEAEEVLARLEEWVGGQQPRG